VQRVVERAQFARDGLGREEGQQCARRIRQWVGGRVGGVGRYVADRVFPKEKNVAPPLTRKCWEAAEVVSAAVSMYHVCRGSSGHFSCTQQPAASMRRMCQGWVNVIETKDKRSERTRKRTSKRKRKE